MALICDPDYLIHQLRLNYLRHVDDPYGPRLISFNNRYHNNPRIAASGLADSERWPELRMPQSPDISDDEGAAGPSGGRRVRTGFPGATGLKYTQTIMGPARMGAMGMRVSGRRVSADKEIARRSISATSSTPRRTRAGSEPTPNSSSPIQGSSPNSQDQQDQSPINVSKRRSAGGSSLSEIPVSLIEKPNEIQNVKEESPMIPNAPMALQSMSHIAAMQARRQRRRAHFSSAGGNTTRPIIISEPKLNPEDSSSDEESGLMSGSMVDDDFLVEVEGSLDAENEFDPDFAPPRIGVISDNSDILNSITNSALSTSMSSAYNSLQIGGMRNRGKLSPVSETRPSEHAPLGEDAEENVKGNNTDGTAAQSDSETIDDYFEIVQPPKRASDVQDDRTTGATQRSSADSARPSQEENLFKRIKVVPAKSATSALTAKLASTNTSSNPFSELYALISGRAETSSMEVIVFFPHATSPMGKPLKLKVRKDATVEETIGFSLWSYWEEGWEPKLDEGVSDEQKKARLSAVGWVLRIAEDDGEVDEDFPAPDRSRKISDFNFDAYAILEANQAQATQNATLEAKIARRPSRIIVSKAKPEAPQVNAALALPPALAPSLSALSASNLGTSLNPFSSSLNVSSSHGSQVLLRIRVASAETDKALLLSSTISVSSSTYMQEVLELICRKRKLENPKEWALLSDNCDILVPLDRTVASLEDNLRLVLVPRSQLPHYGFALDGDRRTGRSIDPNASIFKRISEVQPKNKTIELDLNVYKRYSVYRKVPMLVGRIERTLAIDDGYIHIMPSANKARGVFDSGKTVSYHVKAVSSYGQSAKSSASFKIVFRRDAGEKRYDFEAESAREATEIIATIKGMRVKSGLERSNTLHKSRRRSKHV